MAEKEKEKKKSKFTDACYLMDYVDVLSGIGKTANPEGYHSFKAIECDATAAAGAHQIIASLTSGTGIQEFLKISPAAMAILQPKVRLFKLLYSQGDTKNPIAEPEFIFDDFYNKTNIDSIFAGKNFRVGGVGLKDVNWKLNGTNPAEADKIIEVGMSFEFQSAADLLGSRYNPTDGSISAGIPEDEFQANMIDLILHPPGFSDSQGVKARVSSKRGDYVPSFYRIKMDIGWALPQLNNNILPGMNPDSTEVLIQELQKQEMSLILNLVEHSFEINENGKIGLSVEYIGALEESINGNDADVLALITKLNKSDSVEKAEDQSEEKRQRIQEMNEYIECLKLEDPSHDSIDPYRDNVKDLQEDIKESKEDIDERLTEAKESVYQQFLTSINDKVYKLEASKGDIDDWLESIEEDSSRPTIPKVEAKVEKSQPESGDEASAVIAGMGDESAILSDSGEENLDDLVKKSKAEQEDASKGHIEFLFLGDIISTACQVMNPALNLAIGAPTLITGPIVVNHPRGKRLQFNLADLPISYQDFQTFFFEVVVRKQLASYPLKLFIKDIIERLVKKVLQPSECFSRGREKRSIDISLTNFTITETMGIKYGIRQNYTIPNERLHVNQIDLEFDRRSEKEPVMDCLLLYMNSYTAQELIADEKEDRAKGIYHFYIGAEGGVVKSIDYSKTDVEGLREARQAEVRNLGQIRDVYNASVKLMGNSLFRPGMKVFLNPPIGFGRPEVDGYNSISGMPDPNNLGSISNLLGIGGYYDIITVDSTISRGGQYETTLDCVFAQSGGAIDSIEAKCKGVLEGAAPELDVGLIDGALGKASGLLSSVLGG